MSRYSCTASQLYWSTVLQFDFNSTVCYVQTTLGLQWGKFTGAEVMTPADGQGRAGQGEAGHGRGCLPQIKLADL